MEKFVNDVMAKLGDKLPDDQLIIIRSALYLVTKDYDITIKSTELSTFQNGVPEEVKHFLVAKRIEGKSPGSLRQYMYALKRFFRYVPKPVSLIQTEDIRWFLYQLMQETEMKERSIDNQRILVSGFFKWLEINEYITKNPCRAISNIKFERKLREPLSDTEMESLRMACKTPREKAIIEVLYSTGCRVSELVNISIDDIDFENREVHLFGKGKKHRMAYLNARAILNINLLLESRDYSSIYIFTSSRYPHDKLGRRAVENAVEKLGYKAGISGKVFPHRIRNTTATDALRRGMAIEQVQQLLGHEKIETTLRYAKVNMDEVKEKHSKYII